ncbi:MAG: 50S ribosomal protein L4 [Pseudomonadota bacterium]|uniref:50S ribosomal protein L4 n=1 Tax=Thermithiobacillus tepidarius TaxID=929 RepID=UPI00040477DE|nr:50S ribosomal protein L4 [Thermithiobacillus tepidarius]
MQVNTVNLENKPAGQMDLPDTVFGAAYNEPLVHQVVVAYMAGARAGTVAQKTRSQVRGGGKKPWRQKGTGRARAGTIRSPIWRGGGKVFAAQPRSYEQKVNRKMYAGAMRSILGELLRQDRLVLVEDLDIQEPKTKLARELLERLGGDDVLIVSNSVSENLYLGLRNLPKVGLVDAPALSPVDLLHFGRVVMTKDAAQSLGELLG